MFQIVLSMFTSSAFGTTYAKSTVDGQFATADAVVEAQVTALRRTEVVNGFPVSFYELQVLDVMKGQTGPTVELGMPGGPLGADAYVHFPGTPIFDLGDTILVVLSQFGSERPESVARFTLFGLGFARQQSWGGAPYAVTGSDTPIRDYASVEPETVIDATDEQLYGQCDPEDLTYPVCDGGLPLLSWADLKNQWAEQLAAASTTEGYNPGTPFAMEEL